ncbi:MAG TPA: O-antigen ligase family protein [Devosiaceae bacterium]|nr:O-antigen ligase family protein [Devosiaceae bacterium]
MQKGLLFDTLLRRALLAVTLVLPCLLGFLATYALLILGLVAIGWLLLPGQRARLRLDTTGALLLVGFAGLALIIAIDALATGHPRDVIYALDFGMLLLYGPLVSLYGRAAGPANAVLVADLALAGTVLAALMAGGQELLFHPQRVGYGVYDPIRLGDTTLLLSFFALMGIRAREGARRWVYLVAPVLAAGVGVLAGARSAMLVLPALVVVAVALLIRRRLVAALVGGGALALVGLGGALAIAVHDSRVTSIIVLARQLFGDHQIADEATRQRFALYEAGAEVFGQAPALGVGWHRRMAEVTAHLAPGDKRLGTLPHLHNEVLNFAVGTGLAGVAIYALLLAAPVVGLLLSPRDRLYPARRYGVGVLVVGYVALGLADVMLGFETHTALYVAWAAVLLGYCREASPATRWSVFRRE